MYSNTAAFASDLVAKRVPVFQLMPAIMKPGGEMPHLVESASIMKRKSSLVVCEAHEIEMKDLFLMNAIKPDDDPILPEKGKEYPVMKILEEKKKFAKRQK